MRSALSTAALAATFFLSSHVSAVAIDVTDPSSVKAAASTIAHSMMTWYTGNLTGGTPGLMPAPYYWWEGGATWGALIDYWYYTGDDTYNDVVTQAIQFQASPTLDFMPANQTTDEGNDDQVFWGFAAMTAAEYKFPNPPSSDPQWLTLAEGVANSQWARWDASTCGGGLRWQIFTWNNGYGYKNSPSNAGFVNLCSRLYAYTRNETYLHWANHAYNWMVDVKLISFEGISPGFSVFDGTFVDVNCSHVGEFIQWTYSAGMLLNSAAVLYNVTNDPTWEERLYGLWNASNLFFYNNQILWEQACERPGGSCDTDQFSFKSYFARYMAVSTKYVPALLDTFQPYFQLSGKAAAAQCTGTIAGLYGTACGFDWTIGKWDGTYGLGQQLDALQMVMTNIIQYAPDPVSIKTGGISHGDPSAGTQGDTSSVYNQQYGVITTASRAGAGVLTAVVVVAWCGMIWWMFV